MLGRLVDPAIAARGFAYPWGDLLPLLVGADLFLVNLECTLTNHAVPWRDGREKAFYFRARPSAVQSLRLAGVNFVSLANNHAGDFGTIGLLETLEVIECAGIAHAGAGPNRPAAEAPARLGAQGLRVHVLAAADYPWEWAATPSGPGINCIRLSTAPRHFANVERAVAKARKDADLLIFSVHWGPNMRTRPSGAFREFAHAVIDAGVDLYWGHSAHVVQGVEWWNGKPILYDTGDFVDDYAVDPELRNDLSALFLVHARRERIDKLELLPVEIAHRQVNRAHGPNREWFARRVKLLCAEMGTDLVAGVETLSTVATVSR